MRLGYRILCGSLRPLRQSKCLPLLTLMVQICACASTLRLLLMTTFDTTMPIIGKSTNTGLHSEGRQMLTNDGSLREMTVATHESTGELRERAEIEAP
jgi:hypothetical protein